MTRKTINPNRETIVISEKGENEKLIKKNNPKDNKVREYIKSQNDNSFT